jgi:nitrate reductase NapE component
MWGILSAFVLIALFSVLIIYSVIDVGTRYGKDTTEFVGGYNLTGFNNSITTIQTKAETMQNTFLTQGIWALATVVISGIFGFAGDMINIIVTPFLMVSFIMSNKLGVPAFVTSVILGLLVLAMIFAIWRLIKIGD